MKSTASYLKTIQLLPSTPDAGLNFRSAQHNYEDSKPRNGARSRPEITIMIVLVALGFMYSVHNLIAPNMTAIAKLFHFNNYERDAYIGGELTLLFYMPGIFGALLAGVLSGLLERRLLLAVLAVVTSATCLLTARVASFGGLAWARATAGMAVGGSMPIVYSLVGDWFPASRRALATALVTAAGGAGVFVGQCIATLAGTVDWRFPFLVVAAPTAISGALLWHYAKEPVRGGQEDGVDTHALYKHAGILHMPAFSARQMSSLLQNKTNVLVMIQAFPGNIPWGVTIVYLHDFLVQDLRMPTRAALGVITALAASAFAGVITGGFVGEYLYRRSSVHLATFGGVCNIVRAVPFFIVFGWGRFFGTMETTSMAAFVATLMIGGFLATLSSPCAGAMLLNVNLPETRGYVMAIYSVLDDASKGFGTLSVSMLVGVVGGRAVAYQLSATLWIITGVALLCSVYTYEEDEQRMRQSLDEAALESIVLASKKQAQKAVRQRARAAGDAHRQRDRLEDGLAEPLMARSSRSSSSCAYGGTYTGDDNRDSSGVCSGSSAAVSHSSAFPPQAHQAGPMISHPSRSRGVFQSKADRERLQLAARAAAQAMAASRTVVASAAAASDASPARSL
eukprot:TRINITY_DN16777_c0_g2_i1.p1 TRINITY_DN16777_c0_g2~~TRINITY_DN16777_c0_g2_i1.p1  ORF type:complete len:623 (-),score=95.89 TRINITY_DN16777_c0_g2_i1:38-1906(-)